MAQKLLCNLDRFDLSRVAFDKSAILEVNPQRFEFEQLDAILHYDADERLIVGLRKLGRDEFWLRGHLPGRPIFPGILMIEAAAQLCAFYCGKRFGPNLTYAFGGADKVRFRKLMKPGDVILLLGRPESLTPTRSLFMTQGVIRNDLAFEATILGVSLPPANGPS